MTSWSYAANCALAVPGQTPHQRKSMMQVRSASEANFRLVSFHFQKI
jgi:hypothetical protein